MILWIAVILLTALVALGVLWPLWSHRADQANGAGRERDDEAAHLRQENDRIVLDLQALDLAFAEGKLGEAAYENERGKLSARAERILAALRRARSADRHERTTPPRIYPWAGGAASLGLIVAVVALTFFLNGRDLRNDRSPHADGSVPLPAGASLAAGAAPPASAPAAGPMIGAVGQPDVQAMVARLEARVVEGEASSDDLMMLARSYGVLGRAAEAQDLYDRVLAREPENVEALLAAGFLLFDSGDESLHARAETYLDRALAAQPDQPEALWLKSLILVDNHEIEQARVILRRLDGLVAGNPTAEQAVRGLLAMLDQAESPEGMRR